MSIILRFVHCIGAVSDGILLQTGGIYSHVEAVTPEGLYLGAHADGGVLARPSDYDAGKFDREIFVELTADDAMTAKFYHYLNAVIGEPYAFSAIAGFILHLDMQARHRVICSALQTLAIRWCNFFPVGLLMPLAVPAHEISPRDLGLMLIQRPDVRVIEHPAQKKAAPEGAA
jgi:hypothetical protein